MELRSRNKHIVITNIRFVGNHFDNTEKRIYHEYLVFEKLTKLLFCAAHLIKPKPPEKKALEGKSNNPNPRKNYVLFGGTFFLSL
jgi:hypothetical protein